jgi:hypothetical protein
MIIWSAMAPPLTIHSLLHLLLEGTGNYWWQLDRIPLQCISSGTR